MEKNIVLNENGIGVFTAPIHKLTPEDLPPVDKYVLIYVPSRPWDDSTDFRNVYWKTAKLEKDQYFEEFGSGSYTIDEVKYWMELPNIPKEICETYKEYEERNRTYTHIVFSNDGGETISGTSGIQYTDTHFGYIRDNKKEVEDDSLIPSDFKWIEFKGKKIQDKYKELALFTYLGTESEKYLRYFYNQFNNETEE